MKRSSNFDDYPVPKRICTNETVPTASPPNYFRRVFDRIWDGIVNMIRGKL